MVTLEDTHFQTEQLCSSSLPTRPPSPFLSQREKLHCLHLFHVLLAHGSAWQSLSLLVSFCLSIPSPSLFSTLHNQWSLKDIPECCSQCESYIPVLMSVSLLAYHSPYVPLSLWWYVSNLVYMPVRRNPPCLVSLYSGQSSYKSCIVCVLSWPWSLYSSVNLYQSPNVLGSIGWSSFLHVSAPWLVTVCVNICMSIYVYKSMYVYMLFLLRIIVLVSLEYSLTHRQLA